MNSLAAYVALEDCLSSFHILDIIVNTDTLFGVWCFSQIRSVSSEQTFAIIN